MENKNRTLYTRRWFFLVGLAFYQLYVGLSFASFGQISNFYSQYYNVDFLTVDWFTNVRFISSALVTIPLAWFIFNGKVGLRRMVLLMAFTSTLGTFLVTAALTNPLLMPLIFVGQILSGLAETVSVGLPSSFAVLWFPERQVGTAIAVNMIGLIFGDIFCYLVPPSLLLYATDVAANSSQYNLSLVALENGRLSLQLMYGCGSAVSILPGLLFYMFLTDKPPTAPTVAQEVKDDTSQDTKTADMFIKETKSLFANWSYSAVTIVFGLSYQLVFLENLMMSQIVHSLDLKQFSYLPTDMLSGIAMTLWSVSNILGLTIAGKLVDHCKRYKLLMIKFLSLYFFASVGLTLGVYTANSVVILVTNCLFGFFSGFTDVIAVEIITQLTYPVDEALANTWVTGIMSALTILLGVLGRFFFNKYGGVGVLVLQCVLPLGCIILTCFISSKNKRLAVEQDDVPCTAATPLVQK